MSDLRALLYEPWCPICCGPHQSEKPVHASATNRPPLATRLPECVPPGLEWYFKRGTTTSIHLSHERAELLFIGQAVKVIVKEIGDISIGFQSGLYWLRTQPGISLADNESLPAALAAALHRLADGLEADR